MCTRWNSKLLQISAITSLSHQELCDLLEDQVHKELKFSAREWSQLQELVTVLQPFPEATNLTQGEKIVTISIVLPSVLSLNNHLQYLIRNVRYLSCLVKALKNSLWKRFQGIFVTVNMLESDQVSNQLTFHFILDPAFCLFWIDHDVLVEDDVKEKVKKTMKRYCMHIIEIWTIKT